jgi:hypothetical protein
VRQRCHLLAGGVSLGLEISGHLARHAQKAVNGLSALIETLLRELAPPSHSEICRLHRAFAALLREICCISCHHLSPLEDILSFRYVWIGDSCSGGNWFQHILFLQLQKNAREQFARWNAAKTRRTGPHAAIILSRDFERCRHTCLLARSQSGVAMNCSTAMEHSCRICDSMPVSRAAKRFRPMSALGQKRTWQHATILVLQRSAVQRLANQ